MTTVDSWRQVDAGWGRAAVEFATLSEPANCGEYVTVHHGLNVDGGERLLDVACGAGLAVELARARGAVCAGIDAAPRPTALARVRNPSSDLRVGDMHALPWADASFDVVTSFRGIWGTTQAALDEAYRVLAPGAEIDVVGYLARGAAWHSSPRCPSPPRPRPCSTRTCATSAS